MYKETYKVARLRGRDTSSSVISTTLRWWLIAVGSIGRSRRGSSTIIIVSRLLLRTALEA
jgi:hypothetical protein